VEDLFDENDQAVLKAIQSFQYPLAPDPQPNQNKP